LQKKILELEYQCQRQIYGLIDCENTELKEQQIKFNIETAEDWEARTKFVPRRIELEEDDDDEIQYQF